MNICIYERHEILAKGLTATIQAAFPSAQIRVIERLFEAGQARPLTLANIDSIVAEDMFLIERPSSQPANLVLYAANRCCRMPAMVRQVHLAGVGAIIGRLNDENLIAALKKRVEGESYRCPDATAMISSGRPHLSCREVEVLKHLAMGKTNKEAASDLSISVRTIETHRLNIMKKLHAKHFADLVRFAVDERIVS